MKLGIKEIKSNRLVVKNKAITPSRCAEKNLSPVTPTRPFIGRSNSITVRPRRGSIMPKKKLVTEIDNSGKMRPGHTWELDRPPTDDDQ